MSQDVFAAASRGRLWVALAGVVFCDFIGLMLLSLGGFGWVLGLPAVLIAAPYSAWMALENHPDRRLLSRRIAIAHTSFWVVTAAALFALAIYILSTVRWG